VKLMECIWADGPVVGLEFATASGGGHTLEGGRFTAHAGEPVTFRIGRLELGSAPAACRMSSVDFHGPGIEAHGWSSRALNAARLLHALADDPFLSGGITITEGYR
jgi:hypothetical protein